MNLRRSLLVLAICGAPARTQAQLGAVPLHRLDLVLTTDVSVLQLDTTITLGSDQLLELMIVLDSSAWNATSGPPEKLVIETENSRDALPVNVFLDVVDVGRDPPRAIPARVRPSGVGANQLSISVDFLSNPVVREVRLRDFVRWWQQHVDRAAPLPLVRDVPPERLVEHLDALFVYNPPGTYRVQARYTPAGPRGRAEWRSRPVRVLVYEFGDSFDSLREAADSAGARRP